MRPQPYGTSLPEEVARRGRRTTRWSAGKLAVAWALLAALATSAGCDGRLGGSGGGETSTDGGGGSEPALRWRPCPIEFLEECATIEAPVDWSDLDGPKLEVWAGRSMAVQQPATTQLWYLEGGPGASGYGYRVIAPLLTELLPRVDQYVLVHRGTGLSGFLSCPEQEDFSSAWGSEIAPPEVPGCVDALQEACADGLVGFSTTGDARDLKRFIERSREPDKQVIVYGSSYGTLRVMRFLQLFPTEVDGVLLEGIVAPGAQFLSRWDEQGDFVGRRLATLCAENESCSARLGPDPWTRLVGLHAKLREGHCEPLGLSANDFGAFGRAIASLGVRSVHEHLFPLVYRIERCEPGDVAVLGSYFQNFSRWNDTAWVPLYEGFSLVLYTQVALSELWEDPPPSMRTLRARSEACTLCDHRWTLGMALRHAAWPRYEDPLTGKWPSTDVPMLAWNGGLDAQTIVSNARLAGDHFNGSHQRFVEAPFAGHGVTYLKEGQQTCSGGIFASFVNDPTGPLDTACLAEDRKPTWADHTDDVADFFGPSGYWDNPESLAMVAPVKVDWASLRARLDRLPRWVRTR
jgi:pimeloyl-ACP methyl ester carboxylesterase